jgi:hypothetical protein
MQSGVIFSKKIILVSKLITKESFQGNFMGIEAGAER